MFIPSKYVAPISLIDREPAQRRGIQPPRRDGGCAAISKPTSKNTFALASPCRS